MGVLEPGVLYIGVPLGCIGVLLWVEKEPEWLPTRPALMTEILVLSTEIVWHLACSSTRAVDSVASLTMPM